jgi:hypothetical protein
LYSRICIVIREYIFWARAHLYVIIVASSERNDNSLCVQKRRREAKLTLAKYVKYEKKTLQTWNFAKKERNSEKGASKNFIYVLYKHTWRIQACKGTSLKKIFFAVQLCGDRKKLIILATHAKSIYVQSKKKIIFTAEMLLVLLYTFLYFSSHLNFFCKWSFQC